MLAGVCDVTSDMWPSPCSPAPIMHQSSSSPGPPPPPHPPPWLFFSPAPSMTGQQVSPHHQVSPAYPPRPQLTPPPPATDGQVCSPHLYQPPEAPLHCGPWPPHLPQQDPPHPYVSSPQFMPQAQVTSPPLLPSHQYLDQNQDPGLDPDWSRAGLSYQQDQTTTHMDLQNQSQLSAMYEQANRPGPVQDTWGPAVGRWSSVNFSSSPAEEAQFFHSAAPQTYCSAGTAGPGPGQPQTISSPGLHLPEKVPSCCLQDYDNYPSSLDLRQHQTGLQTQHQTQHQTGLQTQHQTCLQTQHQTCLQTQHQTCLQTQHQTQHQTGLQTQHQTCLQTQHQTCLQTQHQTCLQTQHQTQHQTCLQTQHQTGLQTQHQTGLQTQHQTQHQTGLQTQHQTGLQTQHQTCLQTQHQTCLQTQHQTCLQTQHQTSLQTQHQTGLLQSHHDQTQNQHQTGLQTQHQTGLLQSHHDQTQNQHQTGLQTQHQTGLLQSHHDQTQNQHQTGLQTQTGLLQSHRDQVQNQNGLLQSHRDQVQNQNDLQQSHHDQNQDPGGADWTWVNQRRPKVVSQDASGGTGAGSRLQCSMCRRDFRSLPALNGHMRSHGGGSHGGGSHGGGSHGGGSHGGGSRQAPWLTPSPPVYPASTSMATPVTAPVRSGAEVKVRVWVYQSLLHQEEEEPAVRGGASHYTPPPMLSPVRPGPGLFCSIATRGRLHTHDGRRDPVAMGTASPPPGTASTGIRKPRINVGRGFQAEIPPIQDPKHAHCDSHHALLLWTPWAELERPVNQQRVAALLTMASSSVVPGGGTSPESALHVLTECQGDFLLTVEKLLSTSGNSNKTATAQQQPRGVWSSAERRLLLRSLQLHQKDFVRIQQTVQTKSLSQCVEFYYLWKKKLGLSTRTPAGLTTSLPDVNVRRRVKGHQISHDAS